MDLIAGVDEVGRGPLAGPVVVVALIMDKSEMIMGVKDSKLLTANKRNVLADQIKANALAWSVGRAQVDEIDRLNIRQATLLAMQRAISGLKLTPGLVLVDGNDAPNVDIPVKCIVGGDKSVYEISAASILAKVIRDDEMSKWAEQYPDYGFEKHKGYGTKQHMQAIREHGVTPIHRRSFAPIRNRLNASRLSVK